MPIESGDNGSVRLLPADDPLAVAATKPCRRAILMARAPPHCRPLACDRPIGDPNCYRTLLHAATDWPGHFPNGPAVVARLVAAGADVNAHSRFSHHTETPLHWAASSDDVAVLDALLDAGADIEATGAVLGGGTPLPMLQASAIGRRPEGSWNEARYPAERRRFPRAAGSSRDVFARGSWPDREEITQAFWSACHGGQLTAAIPR